MASVVNRSTKVHLRSVHTPDYPSQDWIINPDLTKLKGIETKYWVVKGDFVGEMSDSAKAAVDAAELSARRDAEVDRLDQDQDAMVGFFKLIIAEINTLNSKTGEVYTPTSMDLLKTELRNAMGG